MWNPFKRILKLKNNRIEMYENNHKKWSWRGVSNHNGKIVFSPHEDFASRSNAERSAKAVASDGDLEIRGLAASFLHHEGETQ